MIIYYDQACSSLFSNAILPSPHTLADFDASVTLLPRLLQIYEYLFPPHDLTNFTTVADIVNIEAHILFHLRKFHY